MKVSDVMTNRVISIAPEKTVFEAARLMLKQRISGLPVIDDKGKLVGIVSESDLLRRSEIGTERKHSPWLNAFLGPSESASDYVRAHGTKVKEVMTARPLTVGPDVQLDEVVHLMETHRIKRLPAVRRGKVIGMVTRANLVQALVSIHRGVPKTAKRDAVIRQRLLSEIDAQSWVAGSVVEVTVHRGVVDLWGTVSDLAQPRALKALAEDIPGVRKVHAHLIYSGQLLSVS